MTSSLCLSLYPILSYPPRKVETITHLNPDSTSLAKLKEEIMKKINVENLTKYLYTKNISHEDRDYDKVTDIVKVQWTEDDRRDWGGFAPKVTIEYEEFNGYMLNITLAYNRRQARRDLVFNARELKAKLMDQLKAAEIFEEELGVDDPSAAPEVLDEEED